MPLSRRAGEIASGWREAVKKRLPTPWLRVLRKVLRGSQRLGRLLTQPFAPWKAGEAHGDGGEGRMVGSRYLAFEGFPEVVSARHLDNLRLCLATQKLDFVVVSFGLEEAPSVVRAGPPDGPLPVIFAEEWCAVFVEREAPSRPLQGRLVRLLPPPAANLIESSLEDLLPHLQLSWSVGRLTAHAAAAAHGQLAVSPGAAATVTFFEPPTAGAPFRSQHENSKPLVFVWPVFLAMGGVERNMIEILRNLQEKYEFVVATIERPREQLGSVHDQLEGLIVGVYELAELGEQDDFLTFFRQLKQVYRPALVWICNGSPWQCEHSARLRDLFADVPIVDQEVYDVKQGWIEWYDEPGIQSYDHFVAVTEKIRQRLVGDLAMKAESVSLIYSAADTARFDPARVTTEQLARTRKDLGLEPDDAVLTWLGRVHPQKRPLMFIELARRVSDRHPELRFLMVGDGPLRDVVAAAAERVEDGRRLKRLGYVQDTVPIWSVSSGYVITSQYEALPIALVEALSMGVPVFAADVGDIKLFVERYGAGAVFPDGASLKEVEHHLERWLERREEYERNARAAAPLVRAFFDSRAIAGQYDACWRRLISRYANQAVPG